VAGSSTDDATFEGWVDWVFNHPVTEPAWYQDQNAERWAASPVVVLNNITRLFEESPARLVVFSDAQADQGLWFLAFGYFDQGLSTLWEEGVLRSQRERCLRSIYVLFEQYFAVRCTPRVSDADGPNENPLNMSCYMWWDLLHHHADSPDGRVGSDMDSEVLLTLERILKLNHDACRRSALHGLGHWRDYCPAEATAIIDRFLEENPNLHPELRTYALESRAGVV
jgi:hypothetical protein